ncbi:MAG: Crp/Fnr family transcriptional regulator [Bacteroidota bacterium]
MENQSFWYLENIDVTGIFCPQKLGNAHDTMMHKTFKKGEYIYLQDDQSDKIFFLNDGRVKIGNYSESGKEITKAILTKGEVFGELSLIGEEKRRDFAQAMEETTTCVLSVDEMKGLMRDHSGLSLFLMKIMGSRVLEMEQRLESLVFKDSRTRIIEFLRDLATKKGQRVGYEMLVRKFMTHQEIANLTATSRQTVTTVLNELRTKNILTFNRRRLLIRDMEKLAGSASA